MCRLTAPESTEPRPSGSGSFRSSEPVSSGAFRLIHLAARAACVACIIIPGCSEMKLPEDTVLRQPQDPTSMHRYYNPMIQNAAAYDMSVADIHFVPHTPRLNDLGVRRLDLLSGTLEEYGGTVRYETDSIDKDHIEARLAEVRIYLTDIGVDLSRVEVASMMSGGRGMSAEEAIRATARFRQRGSDESGRGQRSQ